MPSFRFVSACARLRRLPPPLLGAVVLLAGCGTSMGVVGPGPVPVRSAAHLPAPASESSVVAQLLTAADDWMGVPYRFGGTTRSGVDCSAFVRSIYDDAFGLRLSRATRTQVHEGRAVSRDDLRAGDLVFFRTGRDQRHVGIYLGDGRLLHASSSKNQVLVDDFNQDYFQRTYWTARRLLDVPPATEAPAFAGVVPEARAASPRPAVSRPVPAAPETAQPGPSRSGW